jgi:hypothetical protein
LIFEGGLEDFEKKFPAIQGGKKKYPAAKYIGKKISCAAIYRKKISVLFPWAEKNSCSLNFPTPPSKIKWSATNVATALT